MTEEVFETCSISPSDMPASWYFGSPNSLSFEATNQADI